MDLFRSFLETAKKMPKRSSALCLGVLLPKSISEDQIAKINSLIKHSGLNSTMFTSHSSLEKSLTAINQSEIHLPLVCLISQEQFSQTSFSGLVDLMFKFDKTSL